MTRNFHLLLLMVLLITTVSAFTGCAAPMTLTLNQHTDHYQQSFDSSKAYVYIYREKEFKASGRGIYIAINGQRFGGLNNGTYFVYETGPGDVIVSAENLLNKDDSNKRQIIVESGKKYYIRGSFKSGFWGVVPYVEIVNEIEGEQAVKALSYATME